MTKIGQTRKAIMRKHDCQKIWRRTFATRVKMSHPGQVKGSERKKQNRRGIYRAPDEVLPDNVYAANRAARGTHFPWG